MLARYSHVLREGSLRLKKEKSITTVGVLHNNSYSKIKSDIISKIINKEIYITRCKSSPTGCHYIYQSTLECCYCHMPRYIE